MATGSTWCSGRWGTPTGSPPPRSAQEPDSAYPAAASPECAGERCCLDGGRDRIGRLGRLGRPARPGGKVGEIRLVTCRTVTVVEHGKRVKRQKCTTKTITGTASFTTASARATL